MKRTSFSPVTGIITGSNPHSDKKQRTMQENGPAMTVMPAMAEKVTIETMAASAALDRAIGEATPAASDGVAYISTSLQTDSDDDTSISDSVQWPPHVDNQSLPDQDQQSYLCSRCREIDFEEIISRNGALTGGERIMSFSDGQRVFRNPECAFCQAIRFTHPTLDMWDGSLVAATVEDYPTVFCHRRGLVIPKGKIILTFARSSNFRWTRKQLNERSNRREYDMVGYLAEQQTIDSDYEAIPAVKPHADLDLIKRKLDECRASHLKCGNLHREDNRGVPGMRLIDCKTRTIVPAPSTGCTYAALSYVWGISKSASEHRPVSYNCHEELPAELPNTIADAMLVALRLKIRYLWCDRYCIQQDPQNEEEKREKHGQIARMCDIYSRASVTIIAAAGHGPDYGLPGVGRNRQSPRVRVGSRTLFATLPDPKLLIECSTWSTRGWTFQEGLVARRRLVFTDQQVYFQCGTTGTFEAYDKSGEINILIDPASRKDPPVYPYFSVSEAGLPQIWARIDSYTELTLGNTQDILNAFLGVLRYYEEVVCPHANVQARNVAGLLIQTSAYGPRSWPAALSAALAWRCDIPGKRRDGFPSWSWVGWYCKGFYRNHWDTVLLPESNTGSFFVSVEGTNNELLKENELHRLIEARCDLSEAKALWVTAPSLEARIVPLETDDFDYYNPPMLTKSDEIVKLDNTEGRLAVRYTGSEYGTFINLSNKRLCNASVPSTGLRCFGIILDKDFLDIPYNKVASGELEESTVFYATTLIVVEEYGSFERMGVSYIDREELQRIGSTVRDFRLM